MTGFPHDNGPLPFHPLACAFPLIEGAEFDDLVADVKANGLRQAVTVYDGMILDGRNRYRACRNADVPVRFEDFSGDDPLAFVISANLRRRHMNVAQKAITAARLETIDRGRPRNGQPVVTRAELAALFGLSPRTLGRARRVRDQACDELIRMLEQGKCSVLVAEVISDLPMHQQLAVIACGRGALVAESRRWRADRLGNRARYGHLWRLIDEICDGLKAERVDLAHAAGRRFVRSIEALVEANREGR